MPRTFLCDEVYPAIYSGYPDALKEIYLRNNIKTDIQKQRSYLQELQDTARALWSKYRSGEYVEVDYTTAPRVQEAYVLRYFFPHSLLVPSILDCLFSKDENEINYGISNLFGRESINVSIFGCGPCPELCGLGKYLELAHPHIKIASVFMLDLKPWVFKYRKTAQEFSTDLAEKLNTDSQNCVQTSDLITIQCCLNEMPFSKYEQLKNNLMHIVGIMKPGALMLVIERSGYDLVTKLLTDFRLDLSKSSNVRTVYKPDVLLNLRMVNNDIPEELITHLFLTNSSKKCWQQNNSGRSDNGLWLSNNIKFQWLAVSK